MRDSDIVTLSDFGSSFQENVLALIIRDRPFADQMKEVLEITYFESKHLQVLCQKVFNFKDKYGIHPSLDTLETIIKTDLKNEQQNIVEKIEEFYQEKIKKIDRVENEEFIKKESINFCKKQVLKKAMIESIDLLHKSSFDEISILINDALKKGIDNNIGHDYIADFESRYEKQMRKPISSGFEEIDKITKGGPGKGELWVVVASSGAGKSFCLVWLGAQALKLGKTVVHYTLELSDKHVGNRYDACLTSISLNDLHNYKEPIFEHIKQVPGKLIIKEFPTRSVSVQGLKNHLEKMKQRDVFPDMIIVDYPDLLKPVTGYKEKRHELEGLYEDLRALGQMHECPILAASQGNRQGLNEDVLTMASISEAYSKVFPADFIMSLTRTKDDRESNTGKLFIAKNRNGPDNIVFPIYFDPSTVTIKILNEKKEEEPITSAAQLREHEEALVKDDKVKKAYKNFRKSQ